MGYPKLILSRSENLSAGGEFAVTPKFESHLNSSKPLISDDTFRQIFQSAADAMVITDDQGLIVRINDQTETLFGYRAEELVGQPVEVLVPPGQREPHVQHRIQFMNKARHRPMGTGLDLLGLRKDGTEFAMEVSLGPLQTESGTLVVSAVRDISERQQAEKTRRDLAFETTLSELSASFINLPPERVDEEILAGIKRLGEAVDADRGALCQIEETGALLISHLWARPGFPPYPDRRITNTLPWLEKRILRGEISSTERPEDLPPEASRERAFMESLGIKSSLIVPFRIGGKLKGAIANSSFRKYLKWEPDVIARVRLAAEIFANALARKNADLEIRNLRDQLVRDNVYLRQEIKLEKSHAAVIGDSAPIRAVLKRVEQVAPTQSAVLILGETGTGKELIARTIHELSPRKGRPLVKTNCAALPASLIESELFGREKGAYTGAIAKEMGRFELADGATIFLDEVGELPLELQPKLLRVLQEGEFERLGSSKTIRVDVRIIAATSRDLKAMITDGKFREDLYYRLNVFPIFVPPLRDRLDDIPALVRYILQDLGNRMDRRIEGVQASTLSAFLRHHWPGNVRELRNVIERNLILSSDPIFRADLSEIGPSIPQNRGRQNQIEQSHIREILRLTHWRIRGSRGAAQILGLKPTTLEARMKKLGIQRPV